MIERLEATLAKYNELETELTKPEVLSDIKKTRTYSKEMADLEEIVNCYKVYKKVLEDIESTKEMVKDPELGEMAREELEENNKRLEELNKEIEILLLPKDPNDGKDVIVEIRGAAGGDEGNIFAGDLYRMYSRYAEIRGWKVTPLDSSPSEMGGYKEIVFNVEGEGAYAALRYEGGGHRVQRVPETESQGRVHTSAATVAVFPEADEDDELEIKPEDLRIDFYRAGGAGGQHVNKTDSAVRITHLPTGIVVQSQDERSQHHNKDKCMAALRSRLLENARIQEEQRMGSARKVMIGSGDRSERIRTYNFPQNRLTDHRINLTLYSLDRIMEGLMEELITALIESNAELRLKAELGRVAGESN